MKASKIIAAIFLISLGVSACTYYEVVQPSSPKTNPDVLRKLENRTIILHGKENIYLVANPVVDKERKMVSGVLDTVPAEHRVYLDSYRKNRRYDKTQSAVITEAHIFSAVDTALSLGNTVEIPASTIDRLDIIKKDRLRNTMLIAGIVYVPLITIVILIFPPASLP
jgi:hypothetical protein